MGADLVFASRFKEPFSAQIVMAMWGRMWSLNADLRIRRRTENNGNVGSDVVSEHRFKDSRAHKYSGKVGAAGVSERRFKDPLAHK